LGTSTPTAYDRLGRQVLQSRTVEGRVEWTSLAYDAFGRVVTQLDAAGRQTTYSYNDAAQSMTVTSPGGVVVTTVHNSFGQTVSIANAQKVTKFAYDLDGNLVSKDTQNGKYIWSNDYDSRGLLVEEIDGDGRAVTYGYDAAGRVLSRTVDPAGLNLTTLYAYDGQGRKISVTDPAGRVTSMSYDQEGHLIQVVKDPGAGHLNLTTTYSYDAAGRQLTVAEGAQTVKYGYDELGRRASETLDPAGLNLTTTYAYDKNDNVVAKTDPQGNVTRYAYDENNRLRFVVDATSGVTETA
jgi:YD repeat-containing protein